MDDNNRAVHIPSNDDLDNLIVLRERAERAEECEERRLALFREARRL
jgi:hypothetical protein